MVVLVVVFGVGMVVFSRCLASGVRCGLCSFGIYTDIRRPRIGAAFVGAFFVSVVVDDGGAAVAAGVALVDFALDDGCGGGVGAVVEFVNFII